MDDTIRFPVSEEIVDLFDEYSVCIDCQNACLRSFFKTKKAIYYGKQARKAKRKAWKLIYKLYPDLKNEKELTYSFENCDLYIESKT